MQQFEFTLALLQAAKDADLHTCIETSGASTTKRYLAVLPFVDMFYMDIKETDPQRHIQYTGISNQVVFENLRALDAAGADITLRCPIIPGLNDREEHFIQIGRISDQMSHVAGVHLLPYHALGTSKSQRLGKPDILPLISSPENGQVERWVKTVQQHTRVPVHKD